MNITYILGNGFDLQLGLKTDYNSFYQYFLQKADLEKEEINDLHECIEDYVQSVKGGIVDTTQINWADLEMALGEYIEGYVDVDDCKSIYTEIRKHLNEYIQSQADKLTLSEFQRKKMLQDFCEPYNRLHPHCKRDADILSELYNQGDHSVNVLSFNYTNTSELIFKDGLGKKIDKNNNCRFSNEHLHVHSVLGDIIFGVDGTDQISSIFSEEEEFTSQVVKTIINAEARPEVVSKVENIISETDLFVVYGYSFGESDRKWNSLIGLRLLKSEARVMYFIREKADINYSSVNISRVNVTYKNIITDSFKALANKTERRKLNNKITIGCNTPMFSIEEKSE